MNTAPTQKYSCWLIDNVIFEGSDFRTQIEGENIDLLVTTYNGLKNADGHLKDWLINFVFGHGMQHSTNAALPINCVFIITTSGYRNDEHSFDPLLFQKSLRTIFYPPAQVSSTGTYIPNGGAGGPSWNDYRMTKPAAITTITIETLNQAISCYVVLRKKKQRASYILDELHELANINNVLIELLSIWSFIEGFWSTKGQQSNVKDSFVSMLTSDLAPGKEGKSRRTIILKKISEQNGKLRNSKIDDLRHILAHGMYKNMENEWSKDQWSAIYDQRNLLVSLVYESLLNRIKKSA